MKNSLTILITIMVNNQNCFFFIKKIFSFSKLKEIIGALLMTDCLFVIKCWAGHSMIKRDKTSLQDFL